MLILILFAVLTAAEAKNHVGETATVCGLVTDAFYAERSRGRPTFANFSHDFTIVVWGSDRYKFGAPETEWKRREVCATGKIDTYRGRPQIVATEKSQVEVKESKR